MFEKIHYKKIKVGLLVGTALLIAGCKSLPEDNIKKPQEASQEQEKTEIEEVLKPKNSEDQTSLKSQQETPQEQEKTKTEIEESEIDFNSYFEKHNPSFTVEQNLSKIKLDDLMSAVLKKIGDDYYPGQEFKILDTATNKEYIASFKHHEIYGNQLRILLPFQEARNTKYNKNLSNEAVLKNCENLSQACSVFIYPDIDKASSYSKVRDMIDKNI